MNIEAYLAEKKAEIDHTLETLISSKKNLHSSLFAASRYALLEGGKRLRPILTLATVESFGKKSDFALIPASCIEMVHAYSLIHDDLPCMDDDDFRRGRPTLHKAFSESLALLTGEFFTYPCL